MVKVNPNEKYLVGVSGGPDSIFLLTQLLQQPLKKLVVCHVNYHFRDDSYLDEALVRAFCQKHHLEFEIYQVKSEIYNSLKENFEAWARQVRYDFFVEIGKKYKISNLLIAHNQNDLVETYILQKQRHNLVQYYGLKPVSTYQNLTVIRPMLKIKRSQILDYLKKQAIDYVLDKTNEDSKYQRNKIRRHLWEIEFEKYLKEIAKENQKLEQEINQAKFYLKNHLMVDELILGVWLKSQSLTLIQRIVYEYFLFLNKSFLLQKRKSQSLLEIAKRIQNSKKKFWKIPLGSFFIIQDFDKLYLLKKIQLQPKTFIIKNPQDLNQAKEFDNWLELIKAIKKDGENYPYIVTNNFENYKTTTKYKNKRTNRYLIDEKIPYKKRFFQGVVYQTKKMNLLNKLG